MLKLEKVAKTLDISITLRKKEPLLTKNLAWALLFALSLHLAAGLLFNVRSFLFLGSQSLIPPVQVDSILLPAPDALVMVELAEDPFPRWLREPKKSEPTLPAWPTTGIQVTQANRESLWKKNLFTALPFSPNLDPPSSEAGTQVHFSGPLAQFSVIHSPPPPILHYQGRFQARLEGATGTLFWLEPLQGSYNDHAVEKWLKEFRFQPDPSHFVEDGEIEVRIG